MKGRVHLYTHKEPNGKAYLIADKIGLIELSNALKKTAQNMIGMETVELYSSDGHPYELIISTAYEEEWQELEVPYKKTSDPTQLEIIKIYDSTKKEIAER